MKSIQKIEIEETLELPESILFNVTMMFLQCFYYIQGKVKFYLFLCEAKRKVDLRNDMAKESCCTRKPPVQVPEGSKLN